MEEKLDQIMSKLDIILTHIVNTTTHIDNTPNVIKTELDDAIKATEKYISYLNDNNIVNTDMNNYLSYLKSSL